MSTNAELIASATVVLLRDNNDQLEVLLLQKNQSINYGGTWVFPGGVMEQTDTQLAAQLLGDDSVESTAKVAAVRETKEESGIELMPQQLNSFAHWTTPKLMRKRYATWFFIADISQLSTEVTIDHGEIVEARWLRPIDALKAQEKDEIRLNGPSFVTLSELAVCNDAAQALDFYQTQDLNIYKPRIVSTDDAMVALYQRDSAYELTDQPEPVKLSNKAPLHRLIMYRDTAWEYLKSGLEE